MATKTPKVAAAKRAAAVDAAVAAKPIQQINQGTETMTIETNQVTDRVQAAFGEANERAKTAFDRNVRFAEELSELTKGNVEALVASAKLAAKGAERIGQDVADFGRKSFEEASTAFKGFAEVKSPADFFRLQGDFARTQFDALIAEGSKLSEAVVKLAGEVAEPINNRYSVAAERVKNAVAL